jgi:hypothetical protein
MSDYLSLGSEEEKVIEILGFQTLYNGLYTIPKIIRLLSIGTNYG